jgi:hypothetical protein
LLATSHPEGDLEGSFTYLIFTIFSTLVVTIHSSLQSLALAK